MTPELRMELMSHVGSIYASAEIERIAHLGTTDATVYADEFTRLVGEVVPEMATDRESMLSWFAIAIEAGRSAGCERAHLEGQYEALAWVTTSPAIPKSVIQRIEAQALSLIPRLKELGVRFGA